MNSRRLAVFSLLGLVAIVALALKPEQPFLTIWVVAIVIDLTVVGLTLFRKS